MACDLCSYAGLWTQKGSVFGLMFCCHCLENFNKKGTDAFLLLWEIPLACK